MKQIVKKIMALGLAGVMMLGMATTAFAAEVNGALEDGKGAAGAATTTSNSININKWVVVENPEASITVAYPEMQFNYTVAPKTPAVGANVKDAGGDIGAVTAGVAGGVELSNGGTVTIPAGTVALNSKGQEIVGAALTVNVNIDKFTSAGIYRYEITDTTTADYLINKGVVRDTGLDKAFVLDVYIKNDVENPGTLSVAGYVLTSEEVTHIDGETEKDSGFDKVNVITTEVPGEEGEDPTYTNKLSDAQKASQEGNDFYYTYNATLSKTVTGAMGDTNNTFEFDLAVTNKNKADDNLTYYVDGRTTKGAAEPAEKSENLQKAFLKDGDTVTIYGLNPYATVNYTETNNTASTYTKVIVKNGETEATTQVKEVANVAADGTVAAFDSAQEIVTWAAAAKAENKAPANVSYENNLAEVSPTGVVLRFAPYIIMLGGALFLVLFAIRRRRNNED